MDPTRAVHSSTSQSVALQDIWSCLRCLQIHLVNAKRSLKFGPAQNIHRDSWSIVSINPALLQNLKPDPPAKSHVPLPDRLPRQEGLLLVIQPQHKYSTKKTGLYFLRINPYVLCNKTIVVINIMGYLISGMPSK